MIADFIAIGGESQAYGNSEISLSPVQTVTGIFHTVAQIIMLLALLFCIACTGWFGEQVGAATASDNELLAGDTMHKCIWGLVKCISGSIWCLAKLTIFCMYVALIFSVITIVIDILVLLTFLAGHEICSMTGQTFVQMCQPLYLVAQGVANELCLCHSTPQSDGSCSPQWVEAPAWTNTCTALDDIQNGAILSVIGQILIFLSMLCMYGLVISDTRRLSTIIETTRMLEDKLAAPAVPAAPETEETGPKEEHSVQVV